MRLHSIRVQMILPIALLALILVGLLLLMLLMSKVQQDAMRRQAENYFEAVALILNADRDIYQALIAQEHLIGGKGNASENAKDFAENAQQVWDRFKQFRELLAEEPEVTQPFADFESLYKQWLDASNSLNASVKESATSTTLQQDDEFQAMRALLDQAGEQLRQHTQQRKNEAADDADLQLYVEALSVILNADRDLYQALLALQRITTGYGNLEDNRAAFEGNTQQALQRFHDYRSYLIREPQLTQPYERFDTLFNAWVQSSQSLIDASQKTSLASIPQTKVKVDEYFDAVRDMLDKAGETVEAHARQQKDAVREWVADYQKLALIVIGIAFVIALAVGYYMPLKLTRDVRHIARRIREIADGDGDLTQRIQSTSRNELGDLANEFDSFLEHLQHIISVIKNQSGALGDMTVQLNTVSEQAGRISEGLVNASESMVSAATQMNVSNQQMAELAKSAVHEASHSSELTNQGANAVTQSNQAIERLVSDIELALNRSADLEQSSAAITSVLEVIRTIAEQTNLLALNAAIEAARAGEQGRGFAVVADEVRTLATRTQDSTREIETMIERLKASVAESTTAIRNSRQNADSTVQQIGQMISIFDDLRTSFGKVQDMASQTALATEEQATVSQHISENLTALRGESDGVRDMSERVRSQSQQITDLYQELNNQVDSFKV
ncbi:methyl-accepting chemotaxis protein [Pseudomonas sp. GOM7]|nr:methyl-accepting chemotaxis protein [Pseudomonas sp. GOM7]WAJ37580.1 methyl-accepting chemotaxis protein [Pseudomonas sp. GOM7]